MVGFDDVLTQVLQPYFSYSLVFFALSFVCVKIFLKFNPYMGKKARSIFWLIPLFVPVFILAIFHPGLVIALPQTLQPSLSPSVIPSATETFEKAIPSIEIPSITGILCLAGLFAATGYFAITTIFGHKIATRIFHVISLSPEEYTNLQEKVLEVSQKMRVSTPKVGLIEDLRPNAFTLGYGRRTMLVFSLGLLNLLDSEELMAVVSHELSHVKAKDVFFKNLSHSLSLLSFFNPFSYFALSEAQKERELLADERGAKSIGQPNLMVKVLTKIGNTLQSFPKEHLAARLSSSMFLVSPLARRPQILAAHPQIAYRVHNINRLSLKTKPKLNNIIAVLFLSCVLILSAIAIGYSMVSFQNAFFNKGEVYMFVGRSAGFNLSLNDSFTLPIETQSNPPLTANFPFPQFNTELQFDDTVIVPNRSNTVHIEFEISLSSFHGVK